jgi:cytochrome c556
MRSLVLVLIGLFVGFALTLIGMNALRKGTAYPNGVMAVMGAQMKALDESVKGNRCAATDLTPRLQTLRFVANDLEPAFQPTDDDARFAAHAGKLRAALDAALQAPPADCAAAGVALSRVSEGCKACHADFKN